MYFYSIRLLVFVQLHKRTRRLVNIGSMQVSEAIFSQTFTTTFLPGDYICFKLWFIQVYMCPEYSTLNVCMKRAF